MHAMQKRLSPLQSQNSIGDNRRAGASLEGRKQKNVAFTLEEEQEHLVATTN